MRQDLCSQNAQTACLEAWGQSPADPATCPHRPAACHLHLSGPSPVPVCSGKWQVSASPSCPPRSAA